MSVDKHSDISNTEKLVYLRHSLKDGSAKNVIEGLSHSGVASSPGLPHDFQRVILKNTGKSWGRGYSGDQYNEDIDSSRRDMTVLASSIKRM